MPGQQPIDLFLMILAIIAGMLGGCGAASYHVLSGRQLSTTIVLAYMTLGGTLGALAFLVIAAFFPETEVNRLLLAAGLLGAGSTTTVFMLRMMIGLMLRRKGLTINVQLSRIEDDKTPDS